MRYRQLFVALITLVWISAHANTSSPAIEDVRRLYDLSPVSPANPVLVEVKKCSIEIPVSEFAAFLRSDTPPGREGKLLTAEEKRKELDKLLNDYFWVWEGYSKKADQAADTKGMLQITRAEAMKAILIREEADARATNYNDYLNRKQAFIRSLLDKLDVRLSSSAYEVLKAGAKQADIVDAKTNASADTPILTPQALELPLATCKIATNRVGDLLAAYRQLPLGTRPNLENRDSVIGLLQTVLENSLLLAEAERRGLDKDIQVQQQVQSDRTGLVRMWALDQITRKTQDIMNAPGSEARLKQWFEANKKSRYTTHDAQGDHVIDFTRNYDAIKDDCFIDLQQKLRDEELRNMRQGKTIRINEKLLDQTDFNWREVVHITELAPPIAHWDTDVREYTVKPGETNVSFAFTITNTAPVELVVEDIHPANEFVTVTAPTLPLKLNPAQWAEMRMDVDFRNKKGVGHSPIYVISSLGNKTLTLIIHYPDSVDEPPKKAN